MYNYEKALSAFYLLNQWPDFDQNGTYSSWEDHNKWLGFGDLDLICYSYMYEVGGGHMFSSENSI